ncbi:MAG: hypothetical protein U1A04_07375 [Moraxellaceae bacterium]|nr:hypothetical protein [Moraxellaceae bacterium]
MPKRLEAGTHSSAGTALGTEEVQVQPIQGRSASRPSVALRKRGSMGRKRSRLLPQVQAQRSSAKPNTRGCSGGSVGLFAAGTTQRTMRAGSVPQNALPNPSINRTSPCKPGAACYLKR